MSCTIKETKAGFTITFKNLTQGEVLSLSNALRIARTISPVAEDVSDYLRKAFESVDSDVCKEFLENIKEDIDLKVSRDITLYKK